MKTLNDLARTPAMQRRMPALRAYVKRLRGLKLQGFDRDGKPVRLCVCLDALGEGKLRYRPVDQVDEKFAGVELDLCCLQQFAQGLDAGVGDLRPEHDVVVLPKDQRQVALEAGDLAFDLGERKPRAGLRQGQDLLGHRRGFHAAKGSKKAVARKRRAEGGAA